MALTLDDYRTALRSYIKDRTDANRILKFVQENTNDELDMYINMALGFLNGIPPLVGEYSFDSFPIPSLLLHQATIECLISNGIVYSRNDLTYNNGGVTVRISDGDRYLRQLQMLYRVTDSEISSLVKLKIALNIYGGFGGTYSPYVRLHGTAASLQPNTIF
jgi:hypothetical protein